MVLHLCSSAVIQLSISALLEFFISVVIHFWNLARPQFLSFTVLQFCSADVLQFYLEQSKILKCSIKFPGCRVGQVLTARACPLQRPQQSVKIPKYEVGRYRRKDQLAGAGKGICLFLFPLWESEAVGCRIWDRTRRSAEQSGLSQFDYWDKELATQLAHQVGGNWIMMGFLHWSPLKFPKHKISQ